MNPESLAIEKLAAALLLKGGVSCVWRSQVAAATAYETGEAEMAVLPSKLADAAERQWRGRTPVDARAA
jgi:hypothetical protein